MKRFIIALSIIAGLLVAFAAGRVSGIMHAINDSVIFITDLHYLAPNVYAFDETSYEPGELPSGSDFRIGISLDGQLFEHFGFIG